MIFLISASGVARITSVSHQHPVYIWVFISCITHKPSFLSAGNAQSTSMVQLPGGTFLMGTNASNGRDGEGPVREVTVQPFTMDIFPVTNKDFRYIREILGR
jgi:formylglycine-generating enzyme required for sulfatase activity